MGLPSFITDKREDILRIASARGAYNVRLFGSVVRSEYTENSDVDFLVDMEDGRSLLDLGALLVDLEDLLGRRVDVASENGLRGRIRSRILQEAVPLSRHR